MEEMENEKPNHDKLLWRITGWRTAAIAAGCAAGYAWLLAWPVANLATAGWPAAMTMAMIMAIRQGRATEMELEITKLKEELSAAKWSVERQKIAKLIADARADARAKYMEEHQNEEG